MPAGLQCWDASGNLIFDSTNSRVMHFLQKISLPDSGWNQEASLSVWQCSVPWLDPQKHMTVEPYMLVKSGVMQYYNAYDPFVVRPGNRTAAIFRFA